MKNESLYKNFVETLGSDNTKKVATSLSKIGEHDYENCTPIDIEQIILSMNPNSPKAITTISYMLSLYAKYLGNDDMQNMVRDIDRNALWSMAKPMANKKFISNNVFENAYKDIGIYEEYNSLYIQTLFRAVYEGIYCDDMSVLKNLRGSDVYEKPSNGKFSNFQNKELPGGKFSYEQNKELLDGKFFNFQNEKLPSGKFLKIRNEKYQSMVKLREDSGYEYELCISNELAENLMKLSEINTWERRNRFGTCHIKTTGIHEDSCFKVETRKDSSEYSYRYTYYRILRKISKEYLEYNLLPLQLYISGIMHRIKINLEGYDISMEEAFSNGNRNRIVGKVISDELKRCNCSTEVKNFREMVMGHLDVFI